MKEIVEEAIKDTKTVNTTSSNKPWWEIKFVPQGHQSIKYKKRSTRLGILHKSPSWNVLADIPSKSLMFPAHIALTELRPDLVIFSNSTRIVILIELTCPCEENFEERHHDKIKRYTPLKELIELNGWSCFLFAVEVGARGYCSESVPSCLRSLGLKNKSISQACKTLGLTSMRKSFWIWLSRESKEWRPEVSSKTPNASASSTPVKIPTQKEAPINPVKSAATSSKLQARPQVPLISSPLQIGLPAGLTNLGSTCYANCILQALLSVPEFSLRCMPENSFQPSFSKAFRLVLTLLRSSPQSITPRKFLAELASVISKSTGKTFSPNKEHDVPEVLSHVLDNLCGTSAVLRKSITTTNCVRLTCNECNTERIAEEDPLKIIPLPVKDSIQSALNSYNHSEILQGTNALECDACNKKTDTIRDSWFSELPDVLFLQLRRFFRDDDGILRKNLEQVSFGEVINVPLILDQEVMVPKLCPYSLRAIIYHSGPYGKGHYTANIKYNNSNKWMHCNDSAVFFLNEDCTKSSNTPKTPYVFVFAKSE